MHVICSADYLEASKTAINSPLVQEPQAPTISHPNLETKDSRILSLARESFPRAYRIFSQKEFSFLDIAKPQCQGEMATEMENGSKLLHVGLYQGKNQKSFPAYAYVILQLIATHTKRAMVNYIYVRPDTNTYEKIPDPSDIAFYPPFCLDDYRCWATRKPMITALVNYCFLINDNEYRSSQCDDGSDTPDLSIYKWFKSNLHRACGLYESNNTQHDGCLNGKTKKRTPTRNKSPKKTESIWDSSAPAPGIPWSRHHLRPRMYQLIILICYVHG